MTVKIAQMPPGTKTNMRSSLPGMSLPFVSKHGFPVFFINGDTIDSEDTQYEYLAPPPGMVGCDMRGNIMVIDIDGDPYQLGLKMPMRLEPQPLEIDESHPFFAAARRGQERAAAIAPPAPPQTEVTPPVAAVPPAGQ